MSRNVRQWLLTLMTLLLSIASLGCALVGGYILHMPTPVMLAGRILLLILLAAAGGVLFRLIAAIRQSCESVDAMLATFAAQENPASGIDEASLESDLVSSTISGHLCAISERLATLGRQRDEHKLAARLAQKRSRHLEAVLFSFPSAMVVTDAMDRVAMMNGAASRLFRRPEFTDGAKPLEECIAEEGLRDLLRSARVLPSSREVDYCLQDTSSRRILSVTLAPFGKSGQPTPDGALAVLHDVTRQRAADKMKTEFVANASHELRTPLGGIKAYLEMLTDGEVKDTQTRDRFYNVMQGEVDRLSELVENMLNIARIEAGIVKVSKENVPLTAIVQEVVEAVAPQAEAAGITLECEPLPVFFHIHADKEMMRRAVLNLISNALKYTPKGGRVDVRMHVDEAAGVVTVDVADSGVGISEQDLPQMFQKFFRVESTRKMAKGTGLGLVLVKEVVENLHGGRIAVQSTLGKGSTFSITLSLVQCKQPVG